MSLRRRLITYYLALLLAALVTVGFGLYYAEREILLNGVREDLSQVASLIQGDFETQNEPFEVYFRDEIALPARAFAFADSPIAIQIFRLTHDGSLQVQAASANSEIPPAPLIDEATLRMALRGETAVAYPYVGTNRLMVLVTPLYLPDGRIIGVTLVAQSLATVDRALDALILVLSLGAGFLLLAMGVMVSYVTHRGLLPVKAIASTAEQIVRAEDLSRRIPDAGQRDELGRLVAIVNDLLARLETLFKAQHRLIADVSHELRTPLAAMRGNLEILRRGVVRDPVLMEETLADMGRELNRLTRLVNDLLLLAQSDAGVEIRREPVELDTLVLEVFRELRPLADGVQLRIGAEDQATVRGDRDRLKQALLNLTHNALRFTPSGGEVRLDLERYGEEVRLSVVDTGIGIPPEAIPHLFERFYRVDRSRVRGIGGAGLGLAIVKWIAEAHGGRVEVESQVGKGSVFTLVLPLEKRVVEYPIVGEPVGSR